MFKKVAFTMYPVSDIKRARAFYEQTFGLKSGSAGNQGDSWWVEYDPPYGTHNSSLTTTHTFA